MAWKFGTHPYGAPPSVHGLRDKIHSICVWKLKFSVISIHILLMGQTVFYGRKHVLMSTVAELIQPCLQKIWHICTRPLYHAGRQDKTTSIATD